MRLGSVCAECQFNAVFGLVWRCSPAVARGAFNSRGVGVQSQGCLTVTGCACLSAGGGSGVLAGVWASWGMTRSGGAPDTHLEDGARSSQWPGRQGSPPTQAPFRSCDARKLVTLFTAKLPKVRSLAQATPGAADGSERVPVSFKKERQVSRGESTSWAPGPPIYTYGKTPPLFWHQPGNPPGTRHPQPLSASSRLFVTAFLELQFLPLFASSISNNKTKGGMCIQRE